MKKTLTIISGVVWIIMAVVCFSLVKDLLDFLFSSAVLLLGLFCLIGGIGFVED